MLEGVSQRVPDGDHWTLFRDAEAQHPEMIKSLSDAIRQYAADKQEFNSTVAGRDILDHWTHRDEWNRTFPGSSSKLFGMVVFVAMYDDATLWQTWKEKVGERNVRKYRKVK
jgi:hypothetical protein